LDGRGRARTRAVTTCSSAATLLAQPSEQIQKLLDGYADKLRPTDVQEQMFVREIAAADYRIQQIDLIESGLLAYQMQTAYNQIVRPDKLQQFAVRPVACQRCGTAPKVDKTEQPEPEPPELAEAGSETQTVMMGAAWVKGLEAFALLMRYHGQARRDYYKALQQLALLRTGKAGYLPQEPAPPPAETAASETNPTPPPPTDQTKPNSGSDSHDSKAAAGPFSQKVARFFGKGAQNSDNRT